MAARVLIGLAAIVMMAASCSSGTDGDAADRSDEGADATEASVADTTEAPAPTGGSGDDDEADDVAPDDEAATAQDTADPAADATDDEATAEDAAPVPNPDFVFLYPSEPGDSGPEVEEMQVLLTEYGFGAGTPDGSYGGRTERAIEAFQDLVGLPPTGIADADTVLALGNYRYDGLLLRAGDEGDAVEELQARLAGGPFDPGPVDGAYGTTTVQAVWALEKLAGVPVDGDWGPLDELAWGRLQEGEVGLPEKDHEERWVEVDLSEQLAKVYDPGETTPTLVVHISSGSGIPWENEEYSGSSVTPKGEFHIDRRIDGWRESSLNIGRLYNPLYFNGGIAFHGATSVPLYPASHGCVRLPMHVAEYMPDELPNGTTVHILA